MLVTCTKNFDILKLWYQYVFPYTVILIRYCVSFIFYMRTFYLKKMGIKNLNWYFGNLDESYAGVKYSNKAFGYYLEFGTVLTNMLACQPDNH